MTIINNNLLKSVLLRKILHNDLNGVDVITPTLTPEELVNNGTFDTDATGWTTAGGATLNVVDGRLSIISSWGNIHQAITTVVGTTYDVSIDAIESGSNSDLSIGPSAGNSRLLKLPFGENTQDLTLTGSFVATDTTTWVTFATGQDAIVDNISVKAQ